MTNMRKKNHLPLFRDDLSIFDDFFQSTKGKTRIFVNRTLCFYGNVVGFDITF